MTTDAFSPAGTPIAKSMMRVRLSLPQLTGDVHAKGSRVCVTDSTATARVEVSSLISATLLLWACVCRGTFRALRSKSKQAHAANRKRVRVSKNLAVIGRACRTFVRCRNRFRIPWKSITNRWSVKASFSWIFRHAILIDSARRVCYKSLTEMFSRIAMVTVLMLTFAICAFAQKHGSIAGTVRGTAPGVVVIATNQVTSRVTRARVGADGKYAARVSAGAYRVTVAPPYVAKVDKSKNYDEHALIL